MRGRAELDRRVRELGWTEEDAEYGSEKRRLVASWLDSSGLVEGEMRRLYPDPGQRRRMVEYVRVKMFEKITGIPVSSHAGQWNWNNLWDPLADTSFCAWARRLSYTIAQWNAKRVLHPRERQPRMPHDDPDDMRGDELERLPALPAAADPFAEHPGLRTPRPIGPDRRRLADGYGKACARAERADDPNEATLIRRAAAETACERMRLMGWWDRTLDVLDAETAVTLMLTPMRRNLIPLFERLPDVRALCDTDDTRDLGRAYAESQAGRASGGDASLLRMIRARARRDGLLEWEVIRRLGTACSRLILI